MPDAPSRWRTATSGHCHLHCHPLVQCRLIMPVRTPCASNDRGGGFRRPKSTRVCSRRLPLRPRPVCRSCSPFSCAYSSALMHVLFLLHTARTHFLLPFHSHLSFCGSSLLLVSFLLVVLLLSCANLPCSASLSLLSAASVSPPCAASLSPPCAAPHLCRFSPFPAHMQCWSHMHCWSPFSWVLVPSLLDPVLLGLHLSLYRCGPSSPWATPWTQFSLGCSSLWPVPL